MSQDMGQHSLIFQSEIYCMRIYPTEQYIWTIRNSRLNLYYSFAIGGPVLGFLFFLSFFFIESLSLLCHRAKMKETGKLTLNMRPSGSYQFPNLKNIFVHRQFRVCWIPRCMPWLHFSQKIIFIVYYDAVQGNISLCIWKRTNK